MRSKKKPYEKAKHKNNNKFFIQLNIYNQTAWIITEDSRPKDKRCPLLNP